MYNFDEWQFLKRVSITFQQVMTWERVRNRKTIRSSQDECRKWVSWSAVFSAIAMNVLLVPIYSRKSRDLRDCWIENISVDIIDFAATPIG